MFFQLFYDRINDQTEKFTNLPIFSNADVPALERLRSSAISILFYLSSILKEYVVLVEAKILLLFEGKSNSYEANYVSQIF